MKPVGESGIISVSVSPPVLTATKPGLICSSSVNLCGFACSGSGRDFNGLQRAVMGEKICRLCLWREGEFYEIFTTPLGGQPSLDEQLGVLLNFEIVNDPRLPTAICSNCYKILAFIAEFRLSCSRVNSYLNELLRNSPEFNGNGTYDLVSPNMRIETISSNIAVNDIRTIDSSICDFPGCNRVSKQRKRHKPELSNEDLLKSSYTSRYTSVINHGKEWTVNHGMQIEGFSHAPVPWNYTTENLETIPTRDYNSSFLESEAKLPVVPSSTCGEVEEVTGKSVEIICIDGNDVSDDECRGGKKLIQWKDEDTTNLELPLETQRLAPTPMSVNFAKQITNGILDKEDLWSSRENMAMDEVEEVNCRNVENACIDGNDPSGNDCRGESEFFPWEDEDTIELKLPYEEPAPNPTDISIPKDMTSGERRPLETARSVQEDLWSTFEKKPLELQMKHESTVFSESVCDKDLEQAAEDDNYGQDSTTEDRNSMDRRREIITNHNINIDVDINKAIYTKLLEMQDSDVRITTKIMRDTSLKVAADYGLRHFTASDGWLHSFIRRYEISQKNDEVKLPAYCAGITMTNGYLTRYCCKELNESLHKVCCELADSGVEISAYLIKDFARRIAFNEGLYEFSASPSWFKSFKKIYNFEAMDSNTKHKT